MSAYTLNRSFNSLDSLLAAQNYNVYADLMITRNTNEQASREANDRDSFGARISRFFLGK